MPDTVPVTIEVEPDIAAALAARRHAPGLSAWSGAR
jgi:hypothetical protein